MLDNEEEASILYWASVIAALGWAYAALASFWPTWFQREAVKHGTHEAAGYRIGWAVHWRLPAHLALGFAAFSGLPLLVVVIFHGGLATTLLVSLATAIVAVWLIGPPGLRLAYIETKLEDGQTVFELRPQTTLWRSLIVLIILGFIPALGVGAMLNWALITLIGG